MKDKWNPKGFPVEYVKGFATPDDEAVNNFVRSYGERGDMVRGVEYILRENGGEVYTQTYGEWKGIGSIVVSTSVNWAEPGKTPGEYDEYARTFWNFTGPADQQLNRAHLLAEKLKVGLTAKLSDELKYPYPTANRGKGSSSRWNPLRRIGW